MSSYHVALLSSFTNIDIVPPISPLFMSYKQVWLSKPSWQCQKDSGYITWYRKQFIERASDYCLTPNKSFSATSWREQVIVWWDDGNDVRFVLDQHAELDVYRTSPLKKRSSGRHGATLEHNILIPS